MVIRNIAGPGLPCNLLARQVLGSDALLAMDRLSGAGGSWTCVPLSLCSLGGDELLSAVDVIGCAREGGVGHNVYRERGHVRRSDHASDGKRGAKLVATFFE